MSNSTAQIAVDPRAIVAAGAGWDLQILSTLPKRMIIGTQARDKSGKTHFGLTMPGPIAYINLDKGHEGVVDKFVRAGKRIYRKDFIIDPTKPMSAAMWDHLWYALRDSYLFGVMSGQFRSVFVDTGTAFWEAQRMEAFGKLAQVPPLKYVEINAQFEALISTALNYPVNVVIAHRMKEHYENDAGGRGQKTGAWVFTGYKDMRYIVQHNIEQRWDEAKNSPMLRVTNSRDDMALCGLVLEGPMCNFPSLGMVIHGFESANDWEDGSRQVVSRVGAVSK